MLNNLTGLRFLVSIYVVLYHISYSIPQSLITKFLEKGYLGVDIFFVLSGYVLAYVYKEQFFDNKINKNKFLSFSIKRFARIYPLHFATLLASIIYLHFLILVTKHPIHLHYENILPQLLLIHAWGITEINAWNFPSWSISAEWFAYIFLFPTATLIFNRFGKVMLLLLAVLTWVLLILYISDTKDGLNITTIGILRIIPEFLAGVMLYLYYTHYKEELNKYISLVNIVILLICFIIYILYPSQITFVILPLICLLILNLVIGSRIINAFFGNKIIVFLGEISYSIYMVQFFSISICEIVIRNSSFLSAYSYTKILLYLFSTLIFALLAHFIIERPMREKVIKWALSFELLLKKPKVLN